MKKIILLAGVASLVAFGANATELTASSNIKAKIVGSMTLTHESADQLNFGTMMSSAAHTVSLTSAGARSSTDAGQLVDDSGNTPTADQFTITSPDARQVTLNVATPAKVGVTGLVPTLSTDPALSGGKLSLQAGTTTVKIFGDLAVSQGATAGDYTEPYSITVTY